MALYGFGSLCGSMGSKPSIDAALRYRKTIWGCRFAVRQQQILLVLNEFWGKKIAFAYCQHKQPVMTACCPASGQFCVFSKNILS
jgi:hypothetical protein